MGLGVQDLERGDLVLVLRDVLLEGGDGPLCLLLRAGGEAGFDQHVLADVVDGLLVLPLQLDELVPQLRVRHNGNQRLLDEGLGGLRHRGGGRLRSSRELLRRPRFLDVLVRVERVHDPLDDGMERHAARQLLEPLLLGLPELPLEARESRGE